jgi:predicted transcriptional regulator
MGPAAARELPPPLELECLKALWGLGEASVRQVQDAMAPQRQLAYTTVMTVMDRLARRGCVQRKKSGRSFVYAPVLSQQTVRKMAVQDLVENLFDGSEQSLRQFLTP